jgi:hypothetical protein
LPALSRQTRDRLPLARREMAAFDQLPPELRALCRHYEVDPDNLLTALRQGIVTSEGAISDVRGFRPELVPYEGETERPPIRGRRRADVRRRGGYV